jgi:hypothetical protein
MVQTHFVILHYKIELKVCSILYGKKYYLRRFAVERRVQIEQVKMLWLFEKGN